MNKLIPIAVATAALGIGAYLLISREDAPPVSAPVILEQAPVAPTKCTTVAQWKEIITKHAGVAAFQQYTSAQSRAAMDAYSKMPPPSSWPEDKIAFIVISGPSDKLYGKSIVGAFGPDGCGYQWWPVSAAQASVIKASAEGAAK